MNLPSLFLNFGKADIEVMNMEKFQEAVRELAFCMIDTV